MNFEKENSSFRDPSGFLFWRENILYRMISHSYSKHYDFFINSGLYNQLVKKQFIISHDEVDNFGFEKCFKVIKPQKIPFISYPYEWAFSQFKDAALLTLQIQKIALEYGMTLKDCSAYNVQFFNGKPIFIDTLSFEIYNQGELWIGYKQFCQHFLAPLALMSYSDIRLNQLLRVYIDGIPLDMASRLLPRKTYFKLSLFLHLHMHSKSQKHFENKVEIKQIKNKKISLTSFKGLIDNLEVGVKKLRWKSGGTEWANYYNDDSYSKLAFEDKKNLVSSFLCICKPKVVWDLGSNDGYFSRVAKKQSEFVLSFDVDHSCVENNYLKIKDKKEINILPLFLDLTNPSSGIGWAHNERMSLIKRGPADVILALALIHHLSISNNVPFFMIAEFFSNLCSNLIIEFVFKSDKKVQKLLSSRNDIFVDYTEEKFEKEFGKLFIIDIKEKIKDSKRSLYLMRKKEIFNG